MAEAQSWCLTVCIGTIFCGIMMLLVPSAKFRPVFQMILGLFLLVCLLSWVGISPINIDPGTNAAEDARKEAAGEINGYFENRANEEASVSIQKTAGEYLSGYGINEDEYSIYIGTEETGASSGTVYFIRLTLPDRLKPDQARIENELSQKLGMTVRTVYQ